MRGPRASMAEVAHAGEHHRDAVLVGGRDDFRIALRTAGLMTDLIPNSASASRPSRNGKKASEAMDADLHGQALVIGLERRDFCC